MTVFWPMYSANDCGRSAFSRSLCVGAGFAGSGIGGSGGSEGPEVGSLQAQRPRGMAVIPEVAILIVLSRPLWSIPCPASAFDTTYPPPLCPSPLSKPHPLGGDRHSTWKIGTVEGLGQGGGYDAR